MTKFLKGVLDFFIHFFRRLLYFLTRIIFLLVCDIIFLVTYEPGKWKKVTMRKIKRIRRLTNFKLFLWHKFPWFINFIHRGDYYERLEGRFGNKVRIN